MKKEKDWIGNKATAFAQQGVIYKTKQTNPDRGYDFYATPPEALEDLLALESFSNVWECADGMGHLCQVLKKHNILSRHSDLIYRGCGEGGVNFLLEIEPWDGDIITNPPYRYAQKFVEKALELIPEGRKVAFLLKIQFLESKSRMKLFIKNPPNRIYVWSNRICCALNGDWANITHGSPMMFAWFVWVKGFKGDPIIKWIEIEKLKTQVKDNIVINKIKKRNKIISLW